MQKIIVLFIGLSLVLGLWAYTKANGEEITVCVRNNGLMHVIGEGFRRTECRRNETLLSWNIQGEKGDTGEQGEKGEDGKDGTELHLFDAAGQDLGVFISQDTVFNLDMGLILRFPNMKVFKPDGGEANFMEPDCTGSVYMIVDDGSDFLQTVFSSMGKLRTPVAGEVPTGTTTFSYFHQDEEVCKNAPDGRFIPKAVKMEDAPPLPFTEPLALPLEIKTL